MKRFLEESFRSVRSILSDLEDLGLEGVALSEESLAIVSQWEGRKPSASFDDIVHAVSLCNHCAPAAASRGKLLSPPKGKIRVFFLDSMPDRDALAEGSPIGGEAGALLWKIIRAMGLLPNNVHIGHCLNCLVSGRHLENPDLPCRGFLKSVITLFQPEVLCVLGEKAGHFLTGKGDRFSQMRGHFTTFESIPLMVTHHPADLLLHPERKRETWEDVKKIMAFLETPR